MLTEQFSQIGKPRILVVGDLILDRYTWGNADRVSPEAPVVVLRADAEECRLGGAASVCALLSAIGTDVIVVGVTSDDGNGRLLAKALAESHIDGGLIVQDANRPTTCKERFIGRAAGRHPHQVLRVDHETSRPICEQIEEELIDSVVSAIPTCDAVLVSDYDKGVCSARLLWSGYVRRPGCHYASRFNSPTWRPAWKSRRLASYL